MLPSFRGMIMKLSSMQRTFLVSHYDGLRPFNDAPVENATRSSLISRGLIRYQPDLRSRLGRPDGTVLTSPRGREAYHFIMEEYATYLIEALQKKQDAIDEDQQVALLHALEECARYWKREERRQEI